MKSELKTISYPAGILLKTEYVMYAIAFFIPLLISGPQLLVGITVNALLFVTAVKLDTKHLLPMAILPSIAAISHNLLFGPFTQSLLYFMPFIWIANAALMFVFLKTEALNSVIRVFLASLIKAAFLFAIAYLFVQQGFVPKVFLTAMGIVQLVTALTGGLIAIGYLKLLNKRFE